MTQCSAFRYFKTPPEIIRLAVMLYMRFPLSLRIVEDLLRERGVEISHETGSVKRTSLSGAGRWPRLMTQRSPFRYFKTSPEIIRLAVMLYIRFPPSLRNVEDPAARAGYLKDEDPRGNNQLTESEVFLRFTGDDLDPEEVSRTVSLQPTVSWKKNESFTTSSGRVLSRRTGVWKLEAAGEKAKAVEKVRGLITRIAVDGSITSYLPAVEVAHCHIIFYAPAEINKDESMMIYPPDLLLLMGRLGLELFVDIIPSDD